MTDRETTPEVPHEERLLFVNFTPDTFGAVLDWHKVKKVIESYVSLKVS